jgi:hypothetical protein
MSRLIAFSKAVTPPLDDHHKPERLQPVKKHQAQGGINLSMSNLKESSGDSKR